MRLIEKVWFNGHQAKWLLVPVLLPFSMLFWLVSLLRKLAYHIGLKRSISCGVPVVVVGNIGVGGNGKTPLTLWLIEQLKKRDINVGVISRGYGGSAPYYPFLVSDDSSAQWVGDEPKMLHLRARVPVAVGPDRIAAIELLKQQGVQVVLSDDGLQHYRMKRDVEILVVDGKRQFGNGLLIPAGPLRETTFRLKSVDHIVVNGEGDLVESQQIKRMHLMASHVVNVGSGRQVSVADFIQQFPEIQACAGIGDPARFFTTLEKLNFSLLKTQGFVDHKDYTEQDFHWVMDDTPLLMTEKDAVKCAGFTKANWWYLPVNAQFNQQDENALIESLLSLR